MHAQPPSDSSSLPHASESGLDYAMAGMIRGALPRVETLKLKHADTLLQHNPHDLLVGDLYNKKSLPAQPAPASVPAQPARGMKVNTGHVSDQNPSRTSSPSPARSAARDPGRKDWHPPSAVYERQIDEAHAEKRQEREYMRIATNTSTITLASGCTSHPRSGASVYTSSPVSYSPVVSEHGSPFPSSCDAITSTESTATSYTSAHTYVPSAQHLPSSAQLLSHTIPGSTIPEERSSRHKAVTSTSRSSRSLSTSTPERPRPMPTAAQRSAPGHIPVELENNEADAAQLLPQERYNAQLKLMENEFWYKWANLSNREAMAVLEPSSTAEDFQAERMHLKDEFNKKKTALQALLLVGIQPQETVASRERQFQSEQELHSHDHDYSASQPLALQTRLTVQLFSGNNTVEAKLTEDAYVWGVPTRICRGTAVLNGKTLPLAFKAFPSAMPKHDQELLRREVATVTKLALVNRCNYIMPYIGTSVHRNWIFIVSEYMIEGNMLDYLPYSSAADRHKLIKQVASAVCFLHTDAKIVHGDLKCENVLISPTGDALLADFGLSTVVDKSAESITTATGIRFRNTIRFTAPEILMGPDEPDNRDEPRVRPRSKTCASDVYAFGMLILQGLTGRKPWQHIEDGVKVIWIVVIQGCVHPRPGENDGLLEHISDPAWEICLACWRVDPGERPSMESVQENLGKYLH